MNQELVDRLSMSEDGLCRLDSNDDGGRVTLGTVQPFMSRDLQTAVGTPNVLVSSSDEYRLPNPEMLFRAAHLPIRYGESAWLERPSCLLLPS